jgi:hypothetical protein
MNALEIYAITAPAVALILMGAFGFLLFRRDVAYGKLFAASSAGAAPKTFGGSSVTEPAARQPEKGAPAAGATVHSTDAVDTLSRIPEVIFADVMVDLSGPDASSAAAAPSPPPAKPRRNLLFSSSSRGERERVGAPDAPAAGPGPRVPPPAPKELAAASFEDAWPQSDRARSDALRRTRTPSTFAEPSAAAPAPERPAPSVRSEEPDPVTVLKSGVVDGMAYSLYSDGSIEAQMPEGMMRFASIDELRLHLDQRP